MLSWSSVWALILLHWKHRSTWRRLVGAQYGRSDSSLEAPERMATLSALLELSMGGYFASLRRSTWRRLVGAQYGRSDASLEAPELLATLSA